MSNDFVLSSQVELYPQSNHLILIVKCFDDDKSKYTITFPPNDVTQLKDSIVNFINDQENAQIDFRWFNICKSRGNYIFTSYEKPYELRAIIHENVAKTIAFKILQYLQTMSDYILSTN